MSFIELQELHRHLRQRLIVFAGSGTVAEINMSVPGGTDDELSFLRLVMWSYAVVHESGRVALKFLAQLPPIQEHDPVPEAGFLRTWAVHNISPFSDSGKKNLGLSWAWFKECCGTTRPESQAHWQACFERLCSAIGIHLRNAIKASEALDHIVDGPGLVAELKRRVDRNWDAHRFDRPVLDALARLGFEGIDVVEFRGRHLEKWRRVVALADEHTLDRLLIQRIEADILDLMGQALPTTSSEVLQRVPLLQPLQLALLLLAFRAQERIDADALDSILNRVSVELTTLESIPTGAELEKPQRGPSSASTDPATVHSRP